MDGGDRNSFASEYRNVCLALEKLGLRVSIGKIVVGDMILIHDPKAGVHLSICNSISTDDYGHEEFIFTPNTYLKLRIDRCQKVRAIKTHKTEIAILFILILVLTSAAIGASIIASNWGAVVIALVMASMSAIKLYAYSTHNSRSLFTHKDGFEPLYKE